MSMIFYCYEGYIDSEIIIGMVKIMHMTVLS